MAIRADDVDLERDRDLVQRYQAGDPGAFDDLYRRYFDRLHGYCHRRVGDRHTAEELAQEAFVRALRAMPGFAGEQRFYPWMTVIAQRLCIDHHRRSARVEPSDEVDAGSVEPDHDFLFRAVEVSHLGQALERLAPRHREVLALREEAGLSYAEIAERLAVPVSTVEALLHRARKALRREYRAVVGRDRLWGLPLLGPLVARVSGWRSADPEGRSVEAASWMVPAAAAAAAALALVVPAVVVDDDGTEALQTQDELVRAATSADPVADSTPMATGRDLSPAELPELEAPIPTSVPAVPAPLAPLPTPDVDAGIARVFVDDDKKAEVAEHTETMPIHGKVLDVYYGVDPVQPTMELLEDGLTAVLDPVLDPLFGG